MKIIYPNDSGGISVVHPAGTGSVEDVARKDVPTGIPYLIVSDDQIPADRTYRSAWEADFSSPSGIGGQAPAALTIRKGAVRLNAQRRLAIDQERVS